MLPRRVLLTAESVEPMIPPGCGPSVPEIESTQSLSAEPRWRLEVLADQLRASSRTAMLGLAEQLTHEFDGRYPPGQVIRQAYRSREVLLASGTLRGIVEATEAATRMRLNGSRPAAKLAG
jgi:hypothetical protein